MSATPVNYKPKSIYYYFNKWNKKASAHYNHSKSINRKDRRSVAKAQLVVSR